MLQKKSILSLVVLATALTGTTIAAANCSVGTVNLGSFQFPLLCDSPGGPRGTAWGNQYSSITVNVNGSGTATSQGYRLDGTSISGCFASDSIASSGISATTLPGQCSASVLLKQNLIVTDP